MFIPLVTLAPYNVKTNFPYFCHERVLFICTPLDAGYANVPLLQVCEESWQCWLFNIEFWIALNHKEHKGRCMNMTHSALSSFISVLFVFLFINAEFLSSHAIYIPHTSWLSSHRQGIENNLRSLGICMRHHQLELAFWWQEYTVYNIGLS